MKQNLFLFSLLVLAAFSGCKKDKRCPNVPVTYLEQEMKDWILFDSGSYWIYIDSVTGAYDSVYVAKSLIDTTEFIDKKYSKCPEIIYETIDVFLESSNNKSIKLYGSYGIGSGVTNNINPVRGSVGISNQNHSGGDDGFSKYMFFPVLQGTMGFAFGPIIHDTIYNSYEVLGNTFTNVLRVSDRDNGAFNAITKFYHAKNIGVVRKEIYEWKARHDNSEPKLLHVWELADYKVSQ